MRYAGASQLGLAAAPILTREALNEDGTMRLALSDNAARRQTLTTEQRPEIARRLLELFPIWSDRAIAGDSGLSHPMVAALRRTLERNGQIDYQDIRLGLDVRVRSAPSTGKAYQSDESRRPAEHGDPIENVRFWATRLLPVTMPAGELEAVVIGYSAQYPSGRPANADGFEAWCIAWVQGSPWRSKPGLEGAIMPGFSI
jgi:hypothetical protein